MMVDILILMMLSCFQIHPTKFIVEEQSKGLSKQLGCLFGSLEVSCVSSLSVALVHTLVNGSIVTFSCHS